MAQGKAAKSTAKRTPKRAVKTNGDSVKESNARRAEKMQAYHMIKNAVQIAIAEPKELTAKEVLDYVLPRILPAK